MIFLTMKKSIFFLLLLVIGTFCLYTIFKNITMEINQKEAAKLRDELHNLDIHNVNDHEVYYEKLYYIIASGEGFSSKIYRASKGILTIGYGFNMDRGNASRNEWNQIFKGLISFDAAKKGDLEITKEQARMLKRYGVVKREEELAKIYEPYWDKMRLNERAVLTDLYYQHPKLADDKTRISTHLKEYYRTGSSDYLELAVSEVKLYSSYSKNPLERIGLQNRNDIRAIILDSRKCPLYSTPHDGLIPEEKKIEIILGETVIPKEISAKFPESNNLGDYYIWRARADDKVRPAHQELEGKVFKHEHKITHLGDDYGCRYYREKLPIHAKVIETKNKECDLFPEIIRKYITYTNSQLKYY